MQSALDMRKWFDTLAESFPLRLPCCRCVVLEHPLRLQPASSDRMPLHRVSCFSVAVLEPYCARSRASRCASSDRMPLQRLADSAASPWLSASSRASYD